MSECFNLQLLLDGPFVITEHVDHEGERRLRILVPDLTHNHFLPGFLGADFGLDLNPGLYSLQIDPYRSRNTNKVRHPEIVADTVNSRVCHPPGNTGAYLILEIPMPDERHLISGTDVNIISDVDCTNKKYCTRVVYRYSGVTDVNLRSNFTLVAASTDCHKPIPMDVKPIGGEAALEFSMKPKELTGNEHAVMAYRAMAQVAGTTRYMIFPDTAHGGQVVLHSDHNDCKAALIFVESQLHTSAESK